MTSTADHVALANRNQEALDFLLTESRRFPEWISTVAFYKALHVVDALLQAENIAPPSDHRDRARKLKAQRRLGAVYVQYRALWNVSSVARYLSDLDGKQFRSFADHLAPADVPGRVVRDRLMELERHAAPYLRAHSQSLRRASLADRGPAGDAERAPDRVQESVAEYL